MDEVIVDLDDPNGMTHEYESGVQHNTRCGRLLDYETRRVGDAVTCMMCLGGPSHTTIEDLLHGHDVWILMAGLDKDRVVVTSLVPVRFYEGTNQTPVVWSLLAPRTEIHAVGYYRRDRSRLHVTRLSHPIILRLGDAVTLEVNHVSLV